MTVVIEICRHELVKVTTGLCKNKCSKETSMVHVYVYEVRGTVTWTFRYRVPPPQLLWVIFVTFTPVKSCTGPAR